MMTNNRDMQGNQGGTSKDEETRQSGSRMGNEDVGQRDNTSQGGRSEDTGGSDRSHNA